MPTWWGGKIRQALRYAGATVPPGEREQLIRQEGLTPLQQALFDTMHVADQRHGLDVLALLRREGQTDSDLLLAGLFHDAAKGPRVGLVARVTWSLGEQYGPWAWRCAALLPGVSEAFDRLRHHADRSALAALQAGCSATTADLIRHQAQPRDGAAGIALRRADEAC